MTNTVVENDLQLVVFSLNEKEYAVNVDLVKSIEKLIPITRVPNVPSYIKGVINLRGIIIPVIELGNILHKKEMIFTEQTRIIICTLDDTEIGFIVDEALDVTYVNTSDIETPEMLGSGNQQFFSGILKKDNRLIILLEINSVLNSQEDRINYE